jgi:hypothetical protein
MARLWYLASDVAKRAFGEEDIFQDLNDETDLAQQREGEQLIPELASGKFDAALAAAVKGRRDLEVATFRSLLEDYEGPITRAEAKGSWPT